MATNTPTTIPEHAPAAIEFLTLPEVAKIARAPLESVRDWIASGILPSSRPGRLRLVRRDELYAFLASRGRREAPAR